MLGQRSGRHSSVRCDCTPSLFSPDLVEIADIIDWQRAKMLFRLWSEGNDELNAIQYTENFHKAAELSRILAIDIVYHDNHWLRFQLQLHSFTNNRA